MHHSHQSLNGSSSIIDDNFDIDINEDGVDFNADAVVPDPVSSNNSEDSSEEDYVFVPDIIITNDGDHPRYRE